MKLLMDIGNRRLKWATGGGGSLDGRCGAVGYGDAPDDAGDTLAEQMAARMATEMATVERPEAVWACCVAWPPVRRAVVEYARAAWSLEPVFVVAQKRQAGVVNGYADPAALGSDRWAALVAAAARFPGRPVIVVDAGTAVTVDLLDGGGAFRGGVIFPGVHAMRAALDAQTADIAGRRGAAAAREAAAGSEGVNAVATDTGGAVAGGALLAVVGGVNLAVARQRAALDASDGARCRVIVTGGDAGRLAPLLEGEVSVEPRLVLLGLAVISQEDAA